MRMIILGPPSAGKGTQAHRLTKRFGLLHLATGDLLREAVAADTSLGRKAKKFMDAGALVPDAIVIGLMEGKLKISNSESSFILDGFPRNVDQAKQLEQFTDIDLVLSIDVAFDKLVARATERRICKSCGAVYNLKYNPPKKPGICDRDGGELYQRDDDNEEVVKNRLETYLAQTKPVIDYYSNLRTLKYIEGDGTIDEVYDRLMHAIEERWPDLPPAPVEEEKIADQSAIDKPSATPGDKKKRGGARKDRGKGRRGRQSKKKPKKPPKMKPMKSKRKRR